ncbi:lysophospholipase [Rhodovibrionaceae bacterium A322]
MVDRVRTGDWLGLRAGLFLPLFMLLLAGCSPQWAPPGPGSTTPSLAWHLPEEKPLTGLSAETEVKAEAKEQSAASVPGLSDPTALKWLSPRAVAALEAHPPQFGSFTANDGLVLPLRSWQPTEAASGPRGVIIAVHGFTDYANAFSDMAPLWAQAGYAVYAYDQRGFGEAPNPGLWAGQERMIQDLRDLAQVVRQDHPGLPLYLLGESMGGAVVLVEQSSSDALEVAGLVLSAPAVWARATQPWYQRAGLWLAVRLTPGLAPTSSGIKIRISDNDDMLRALSRDPLMQKSSRIDRLAGLTDLMDAALDSAGQQKTPLLMLYGQKDEVIPATPSQLFWAGLPNKDHQRLALYPEGWHLLLRDLQAERVSRDILAWLDDPTAPLPSGQEAQAIQTAAED